MLEKYLRALGETLLMVSSACLVVFVVGLTLAIVLTLTAPGGLRPQPRLHRTLSVLVNTFRSVPFIIGTTMGTWAAVVPLSAHLIPFFARVSQVGLNEVDHGLVEAARAMGCRRWHIVRHVLLPEALPALVGGATVTVIAMIGASAMAGAVGAGGLGDLGIRYGYERYETAVMFNVIAILVVLVTLVQLGGERLARRIDHRQ